MVLDCLLETAGRNLMTARTVAGVMLALMIATGPALACMGDEVMYSDDFSDPELSKDQWSTSKAVSIEKGYLQIKPEKEYVSLVRIPSASKEFDLCVDITYPEAKKPDGGTWGGFIFWWKDWKNYYYVWSTPVGVSGAFRVAKERTLQLSKKDPLPGVKTGA